MTPKAEDGLVTMVSFSTPEEKEPVKMKKFNLSASSIEESSGSRSAEYSPSLQSAQAQEPHMVIHAQVSDVSMHINSPEKDIPV